MDTVAEQNHHSTTMDPNRAKEIMGQAHTYWSSFVEKESPVLAAGSLFGTTTKGAVNPVALRFFRYCCELVHCRAGSIAFQHLNSAPSWLWHQGGGVAIVLLDQDKIAERIKDETERKKITTRIILHEAGHVVLHYNQIVSLGRGHVPSSNENQEEEAWVFCGAVLGLALGQFARSGRPGIIDRAWPHCC